MKLFRKWLSLLLVVMLAAGIIGTASAADPNFDVKDGIAIKYIGTATEITADMFTDEKITTIGASCFNGKDITKVTMPKTVKSIQAGAFAECRFLTEVTLSPSITSIPDNCFANATSLKAIAIPSGVTSIGQYAFRNCVSLKAVEGTATVKTKYSDTYKPVTGNVTSVGTDAFANCPQVVISCFKGSPLEEYAIAHSVKYESLDPVIDKITVRNPPEYTMIYDKSSANTLAVSYTVSPAIASGTELAWSSSDTSIAEVSQDGVVTPKKAGVITVTVASANTIDGLTTPQASVKIVILDSAKTWQQWPATTGSWYYCTSNTTYATGWQQIGSKWYYFEPTLGKALTGWLKISGSWYYTNSSGAMLTGWQKIDEKWYYFNGSGVLYSGWLSYGGKWYYLDSQNGSAMVTGARTIGGVNYIFRDDGSLIDSGWYKEGGKWYYLNDKKAVQKGWIKDGGKWYYLSPVDGAMLTGWQQVNGVWYYMNASGAMQTGWQKLDGGKWYYLNKTTGAMETGWLKLNKTWYYLNADGSMAIGWLQIKGVWYYFDASGAMVTGTQTINGTKYTFNKNGAWIK